MNSNSNLCTKSQTQLQNQYGPIVPEKVANQTRVQPTCIIGIKKGGQKFSQMENPGYHVFCLNSDLNCCPIFTTWLSTDNFPRKDELKKRARFLVQLSKEKCPNMQTGCFQLPLLGSASSLVIYRTTSRIHLRLLQFNGVKLFLKAHSCFDATEISRDVCETMAKDNLNKTENNEDQK